MHRLSRCLAAFKHKTMMKMKAQTKLKISNFTGYVGMGAYKSGLHISGSMGGSRGGGRGSEHPPLLKNHKNLGFIRNTGPYPLKNLKATKPAFNVGRSSSCQRNVI